MPIKSKTVQLFKDTEGTKHANQYYWLMVLVLMLLRPVILVFKDVFYMIIRIHFFFASTFHIFWVSNNDAATYSKNSFSIIASKFDVHNMHDERADVIRSDFHSFNANIIFIWWKTENKMKNGYGFLHMLCSHIICVVCMYALSTINRVQCTHHNLWATWNQFRVRRRSVQET